jgi:parallel beta-helix repeat protein
MMFTGSSDTQFTLDSITWINVTGTSPSFYVSCLTIDTSASVFLTNVNVINSDNGALIQNCNEVDISDSLFLYQTYASGYSLNFTNVDDINVESTTFQQNSGYSVYLSVSFTTATITKSTFQTISYGISTSAPTGSVLVTQSNFENVLNNGIYFGGYFAGSLTVTGSTFISNRQPVADFITASPMIQIVQSVFQYSSSNPIYLPNSASVNISQCSFVGNAGGVYITSQTGQVLIENTIFVTNNGTSLSLVSTTSGAVINGCIFKRNQKGRSPGVVSVANSVVDILASTMVYNTDAAVYYSGSSGQINSTTIWYNSVGVYLASASNVTVTDTSITQNIMNDTVCASSSALFANGINICNACSDLNICSTCSTTTATCVDCNGVPYGGASGTQCLANSTVTDDGGNLVASYNGYSPWPTLFPVNVNSTTKQKLPSVKVKLNKLVEYHQTSGDILTSFDLDNNQFILYNDSQAANSENSDDDGTYIYTEITSTLSNLTAGATQTKKRSTNTVTSKGIKFCGTLPNLASICFRQWYFFKPVTLKFGTKTVNIAQGNEILITLDGWPRTSGQITTVEFELQLYPSEPITEWFNNSLAEQSDNTTNTEASIKTATSELTLSLSQFAAADGYITPNVILRTGTCNSSVCSLTIGFTDQFTTLLYDPNLSLLLTGSGDGSTSSGDGTTTLLVEILIPVIVGSVILGLLVAAAIGGVVVLYRKLKYNRGLRMKSVVFGDDL